MILCYYNVMGWLYYVCGLKTRPSLTTNPDPDLNLQAIVFMHAPLNSLFLSSFSCLTIHLFPLTQVGTDSETLEKQYKVVRKETTTSHVMQYGDLVSHVTVT